MNASETERSLTPLLWGWFRAALVLSVVHVSQCAISANWHKLGVVPTVYYVVVGPSSDRRHFDWATVNVVLVK